MRAAHDPGSRPLTRSPRGRLLAGLLLAFLAAAGRGVAERSAEPAAAMDARFDAVVRDAMARGPYPGIAVMVSRRGETLFARGYGLADIENQVPVTADTVFAIGSVTKSFTALAVAQLVERGRLGLDDTVGSRLPEYTGPARDVRIRHLLDHTSGLYNYVRERALHANPGRHYAPAEIVALFKDRPLAFAPGSQFAYTNSGTFLLGLIIERVAGTSYAQYLDEHVFTPFGMRQTRYADLVALVPRRARGYRPLGGAFVNVEPFSATIPFSAGALLSTVGDLDRYARAVHHGPLVSDAVRRTLYTQDTLVDGSTLQYALGALVIRGDRGRRKFSHSGDVFGFASHFAHYPDDDVTISVLTNNQAGRVHPSSIERKLARAVFGEPAPSTAGQALPDTLRARLVGAYTSYPMTVLDQTLHVADRDGRLALVFGRDAAGANAFPLVYVGRARFVAAGDDEIVVDFDVPREGPAEKLTLEIHDGAVTARRAATPAPAPRKEP